MNRKLLTALLAISVLGTACATSGGFNIRPQDIPSLEQRVAAQPTNSDLVASLGIAYYGAKRYDDAVKTLARVDASSKAAGVASLYIGLSNEELKNWSAARTAYEAYLANGTSAELKDRIRARLPLVAREELRTDAKTTLAREAQLSTEAPTPRTVAVMPFRLVGTNADLEPLETALTDMIITDLSISPSLKSVERAKIKAMINEMLLAKSGLSEAGTGARVGHLLKAEHVVQGVLAQNTEKDLRMDATILNTERAAAAGTFGQNQSVDAIFDLEKATVFNIYNTLGVTLTQAERDKINENRTGNLVAFLAYGRGLNELDRGNYKQAETFFRQATQLDPSFQRAQSTQAEASQLQQASSTSTNEIASAAVTTEAPAVVAASVSPGLSSSTNEMLQATINDVNPTPAVTTTQTNTAPTGNNAGANAASNASGNLGQSQGQNGGAAASAKATIIITIKKPGT